MTDRQAEQATQEQVRTLVSARVFKLTARATRPCPDCGAEAGADCKEGCTYNA